MCQIFNINFSGYDRQKNFIFNTIDNLNQKSTIFWVWSKKMLLSISAGESELLAQAITAWIYRRQRYL